MKTIKLSPESREELMRITKQRAHIISMISHLTEEAGILNDILWDRIYKEVPFKKKFKYAYNNKKHTLSKIKKEVQ